MMFWDYSAPSRLDTIRVRCKESLPGSSTLQIVLRLLSRESWKDWSQVSSTWRSLSLGELASGSPQAPPRPLQLGQLGRHLDGEALGEAIFVA